MHFLDRETGQTFRTESQIEGETADAHIHLTKWLEEWDFGDYEGLTLQSIKDARMKEFGDPSWDIWKEGCPGGEYVFPFARSYFLGWFDGFMAIMAWNFTLQDWTACFGFGA
jgi:hypothetical protein